MYNFEENYVLSLGYPHKISICLCGTIHVFLYLDFEVECAKRVSLEGPGTNTTAYTISTPL